MPKREVILTSGHTEQNGWKERARAAEQKERWKILGKNKLTQIESQVFFEMDSYVMAENRPGPTDLVRYSLNNVN